METLHPVVSNIVLDVLWATCNNITS